MKTQLTQTASTIATSIVNRVKNIRKTKRWKVYLIIFAVVYVLVTSYGFWSNVINKTSETLKNLTTLIDEKNTEIGQMHIHQDSLKLMLTAKEYQIDALQRSIDNVSEELEKEIKKKPLIIYKVREMTEAEQLAALQDTYEHADTTTAFVKVYADQAAEINEASAELEWSRDVIEQQEVLILKQIKRIELTDIQVSNLEALNESYVLEIEKLNETMDAIAERYEIELKKYKRERNIAGIIAGAVIIAALL